MAVKSLLAVIVFVFSLFYFLPTFALLLSYFLSNGFRTDYQFLNALTIFGVSDPISNESILRIVVPLITGTSLSQLATTPSETGSKAQSPLAKGLVDGWLASYILFVFFVFIASYFASVFIEQINGYQKIDPEHRPDLLTSKGLIPSDIIAYLSHLRESLVNMFVIVLGLSTR